MKPRISIGIYVGFTFFLTNNSSMIHWSFQWIVLSIAYHPIDKMEDRVCGGRGPLRGILPLSLPFKAALFFWGSCLTHLEIICNSWRSPGQTWRLASRQANSITGLPVMFTIILIQRLSIFLESELYHFNNVNKEKDFCVCITHVQNWSVILQDKAMAALKKSYTILALATDHEQN